MQYLSIKEISYKCNMKDWKLTALCRDNRIADAIKFEKECLMLSDALKPLDNRTNEFDKCKV